MKRVVRDLAVAATRVRDTLELETVYLRSAEMSIGETPVQPPYETSVHLKVSASATADLIESHSTYVATAVRESSGESELAWSVSVQCVARFAPDDIGADLGAISADDLQAFALMIGAPIVHPYARECIQDLTARSPYPAFTVGMLTSLTELPEDHELDLVVDAD